MVVLDGRRFFALSEIAEKRDVQISVVAYYVQAKMSFVLVIIRAGEITSAVCEESAAGNCDKRTLWMLEKQRLCSIVEELKRNELSG